MFKKMRSGFRGDFQAIAKGIYEMMDENYQAALAFGMLPAPLMEMAEKHFLDKLTQDELKRLEMPEDPTTVEMFRKAIKPEVISDFRHELAVAMLAEAKSQGALVV